MNTSGIKANILIIDSDTENGKRTAEYLRRRGLSADTAPDAAAAMEILHRPDNGIDAVIADWRTGGADLPERIRNLGKTAPVCIILADGAGIRDAVTAMKRGAADFLEKPVRLSNLASAVDEVLLKKSAEEKTVNQMAAVQYMPPVPFRQPHPVNLRNHIVFPDAGDTANPMRELLEKVKTVSATRATVLLTGESGTGKEIIANLLHAGSGRKGPFVAVHCAALSASLLSSELFGYEKGAFTGAAATKAGKFEAADGGTIFLDEIGEIDAATQIALLRVLETRTFQRVGGNTDISVDVRIVAATNRNLLKMVRDGNFREDLYYRLSIIELTLPPLRERRGEIPRLVAMFAAEFARENLKPTTGIAQNALSALIDYPWPGNIRELRNAVEYMVILSRGQELQYTDLPVQIRRYFEPESNAAGINAAKQRLNVEQNEKMLIRMALDECGGNKTRAAEKLGMSRRTLYRKLKEYSAGNNTE